MAYIFSNQIKKVRAIRELKDQWISSGKRSEDFVADEKDVVAIYISLKGQGEWEEEKKVNVE